MGAKRARNRASCKPIAVNVITVNTGCRMRVGAEGSPWKSGKNRGASHTCDTCISDPSAPSWSYIALLGVQLVHSIAQAQLSTQTKHYERAVLFDFRGTAPKLYERRGCQSTHLRIAALTPSRLQRACKPNLNRARKLRGALTASART